MYRMQQGTLLRPVEWLEDVGPRRAGIAILVAAMVGAAALILWLERGTTYMSDEWGWVNFAGEGSVADMFRPLNQHLSVLVLLPTKAGLDIWGTEGAMLPFQLLQVAGVLGLGAAVYAFARPRVGPLVALAPAMIPMYLGTATVILLQPLIGLQVLYSLALGVGAMVALDRGSRGGDVAAAIMVVLSLASFSTGIAFLAGVTVSVLLSPDPVRRAFVFLVPAALYGGWRLWAMKYGTTGGPELANVPALPLYYSDSIASTVAALFGRSPMLGPGPGTYVFLHGWTLDQASAAFVFSAVEVVVIVIAVRRLRRLDGFSPTLWATLATLLALWTIQGLVLVDGRTPGESRYIYPGAIAMSLVVVEAVRRVRFSQFAVTVILALTLVGIAGNLVRFNDGRNLIEYLAPRNLAYTGLMDLAGKNADPEFVPSTDTPIAAPATALSIPVSAYQAVSARHGPWGYSPAEVLDQPADIRHGADEVMIGMLRLELAPARDVSAGRCRQVIEGRRGNRARLPRGGAVLRTDATTQVSLRRFGERPGVELGRLEAGQPALLRIPPDSATQIPWLLETAEPATLTVCAVVDAA